MSTIVQVLVAVVAALHVFFFVLEALLWKSPTGRRVFGTTREFAAQTAALAANQGLYNLFLAAGLVWSLMLEPVMGWSVATFFLGCVIVAGIFGALTVNPRIFLIQGVPAVLALVVGMSGH